MQKLQLVPELGWASDMMPDFLLKVSAIGEEEHRLAIWRLGRLEKAGFVWLLKRLKG